MAKRVVEPLNKLNLEKPMENDAKNLPHCFAVFMQQLEIKSQMRKLKIKKMNSTRLQET